MKIVSKFIWLTTLAAGAILATTAQAADLPEVPLSSLLTPSQKSATLAQLVLPELGIAEKRAAVVSKQEQSGALAFAQPFYYDIDTQSHGSWTYFQHRGESVAVWRLVMTSPDAMSLNLGFSQYHMPEGGHLFIYADRYQQLIGPFSARDNEEHAELWTPVIDGKTLTIEVNIRAESKQELKLKLSRVNQAFLDFSNISNDLARLKSGSCNVDVVCPASMGWEDQVRSVAAITLGGINLCSGAAVNNSSGDLKPYFLTAHHCGITSSNSASVIAYWNYQNSVCRAPGSAASGNPGDGSKAQFNSGAILRASSSLADFTLLEFDDPIVKEANVFLAGWNRGSAAASSGAAIHHPAVEEKRISFEDDPVALESSTVNISGTLYGPNTMWRVNDWDSGTTEGGSSGSPLFDQNRRIIGQLTGGAAACGNNAPDWYGRLAIAWDGASGAASQNLKSWLDPAATGLTVLDGKDSNQLDGFEPDNELAAATTLEQGSFQTHSVHVPSDQDWFTFSLGAMSEAKITIESDKNWTAELLDSEQTSIDSQSGAAQGNILIANPGTYYLRIEDDGQNDIHDSYTVRFELFTGDGFEDDDDAASATLISLGESQTHSIYPIADEDWLTFTLDTDSNIILRTKGVLGDTKLSLYDSSEELIAENDDAGSSSFSKITANLEAGDYFIRVESPNSGLVSLYELTLEEDDDFLLQVIPAIIGASKK